MRTCSICNTQFTPRYNTLQRVCSIDCSREYVRLQRETEYRKETRKRKKKIQSEDRGYQLKKAQAVFHAYIKGRDKGKPCISCDKPDNGSHQRHASHFRSVGAQGSIRFHEMNVHTSCAQCNTMKSGNLIEYRIRLVKKIGQANVEWLETDHAPYKFTIEEIKEIREYYKGKIKWLENQKKS